MSEKAEKKEGEAQEAAAPTSRKRKLIIAGAAAAVCLGIGTPLGFFLLKPEEKKEEQPVSEKLTDIEEDSVPESSEGAESALREDEESLGAIVPFETFLVNLSGGKYLRLQMQAEFVTPDVPKRLYSRLVPIRDSIISMLTEQSATALEDSQGKEKVKKNIRDIINEQLRREDVRRIYFTQFVIQ
jgi:flagellar basal body-associated protein FliL